MKEDSRRPILDLHASSFCLPIERPEKLLRTHIFYCQVIHMKTSTLQLLQENLSFLGVSLALVAVILLVALGSEYLVMKKRHRLKKTRAITFIAMFSAIAAVLHIVDIPLFFAPSFYKLDFSELPVMICAFYMGPVAGVTCEFVKIILKLLIKGTSTAFVGDLANFLVGCSFVLPAAICYQATLSKKGAILSLALGTAVMSVFGSMFNAWYLIPKFSELFGMPMDAIISMGTAVNSAITNLPTLVLFAVVPFNILKGVLVSILTMLLYKRVEKVFFRRKKSA
jgi:riboflavin transporter FmnP